MRNYEQIRAKNALKATTGMCFTGKDGGQVAKKIPARIQEDGLLPAISFAIDKMGGRDKDGWGMAFLAIVQHLSDAEVADGSVKGLDLSQSTSDVLINWARNLAECDTDQLRRTTNEALAYLLYFRRFAKKGLESRDGAVR